jgi:ferric-dicitrate binding protein FerR (iron transport regulator)
MNVEALIHALLEGEITPSELAQLEARLREDWQARRLYLELADQHAGLLQQGQLGSGRLESDAFRQKKPSAGRRLVFLWPLAMAAGIAASVALSFWVWPRSQAVDEATAQGVAVLSQMVGAEFSNGPRRSGESLTPGTLKLERGLAQIEFFSGATVVIEGSSEIEVLSSWEARCVRGRVRVHVPPAARGFMLHAPDLKLEDLGTEFALNVTNGRSDVRVFEGEVVAHNPQGQQLPASLKQGMSLGNPNAGFLSTTQLQSLVREREQGRFDGWQTWSAQVARDPRLIAYYPFNHLAEDRWDRSVENVMVPGRPERAGGAVGVRWVAGRWERKTALEFKRPGDRVRMTLEGAYEAVTFSAWVKVDSLDKKYNSLLLTDGYDEGEPHWQIYEDGRLMFSIHYWPGPSVRKADYNQIYFSRPVLGPENLGRWHHLAVTYDNQSGLVTQFFDGKEAGREVSALHQPGRPIRFGPCELGNWGLPTTGHRFPIRNLNGAMDEFAIYGAALSPEEIEGLFEKGRPE